jgi:hypothetical protein
MSEPRPGDVAPNAAPQTRPLPIVTVGELTRLVRDAVGRVPGLRDVWD